MAVAVAKFSSLLCYANDIRTEELAARIGDAWGGLLNASFGNAVELLIAILALVKGDLDIVQASMAGSILSNILLVLGMSYFAGGLRFHEQLYTVVGAQTHIALLGITIAAILLPEAFHLSFPATKDGAAVPTGRGSSGIIDGEELKTILSMSRGLSFILLIVYGMYLTFQLWTHAYLFKVVREEDNAHDALPEPNHARVFPKPHWVPSLHTVLSRDTWHADGRTNSRASTPSTPPALRRVPTTDMDAETGVPLAVRRLSNIDLGAAALQQHAPEGDVRWREKRPSEQDICDITVSPVPPPPHLTYTHDVERGPIIAPKSKRKVIAHINPRVPLYFALAGMLVCTGLAGLTAEALVSSIDGLTESTNVSREFIGLIVLPVVGNAVEHITAVTVSLKDRLNLSLSIAVGSSVQVSLCILPLLVLLGWAVGQPMTLLFDTFETICLVIAVVLVNFAISDGRSNYLEGFVLMMAFVCIATVCWFYDPAH